MQTIAVYDDSSAVSRQTSSFLKSLLGSAAKILIGVDAFKGAIRNNQSSVRDAIAQAKQTAPSTIDAQLRANGINPAAYWAAMEREIPENADAMSPDDINSAISSAEQEAKDPTQMVWLIGGLCLLIMFGMEGRRFVKHARSMGPGGTNRWRNWRAAFSNYARNRFKRRRRR